MLLEAIMLLCLSARVLIVDTLPYVFSVCGGLCVTQNLLRLL